MKKILISRQILVLALATSLFVSCKKAESVSPANQVPSYPTPQPVDAIGVLVAVKTKFLFAIADLTQNIPGSSSLGIPDISFDIGIAAAYFFKEVPPKTYIDAGDVKLNNISLKKGTDNIYAYNFDFTSVTQTSTDALGLDFSKGVTWSVAGANGITAVSKSFNTLPNASIPSTVKEVNTAADFILKSDSNISADSVYFVLNGADKKQILKRFKGNIQSCTFKAAEMTSLKGNGGFVMIVPFNIVGQSAGGGKKVYFVNLTQAYKSVTFK